MKIIRYKNDFQGYNYTLEKDDKRLEISFARNLDLYMILRCNRNIGEENIELYFDITKENNYIYSLFDSLYNDIITGNIFDEYSSNRFDYTKTEEYRRLVDCNNNITWISDDGPQELEDRVIISKLNSDTYRLLFIRNDKEMDFGFKSPFGIVVRFRNSGSMYDPFNCIFMKLYNKLQDYDPDYHQIHIEELKYIKRKVK